MKVRVDSAFVGSVLFTVALLSLVPVSWNLAVTGRGRSWHSDPDVWFREVGRLYGDLGVTCLAVILIGLIVTWGAYVKRSRWAWLVMLVLTWGWAFPIFVLPLQPGHWVLPFREVLFDALHHSGGSRIAVETLLTFSMMVMALILPLPSFIHSGERQPRWPVRKVIAASGFMLLFVVIALLAWTHLTVYEIPPEQLRVWQISGMPPPPPPPNVANKGH
jgi:hypothetical protein